MSLYVLSDIHLSLGCEKPMDIFSGWEDYVDRLKKNWLKKITAEDVVVLPGDISWGTTMDEAFEDFNFLHCLPGKKVILKGNHDYWWNTMSKMRAWLSEKGLDTIVILNNNCYIYDKTAICGTRGWIQPGTKDDVKVYNRELQRLRLSLEDGKKNGASELCAFIHYPPVYSNYKHLEVIEILSEYGVKRCFYGHVHGESVRYAVNGVVDGIEFKLVSADYLRFCPLHIDD